VTTYVIDASVAVRWLVELPHSDQARALLSHQNRLIAPDFLPAEVGSALTKLVRAKVVSQTAGAEAYHDFFRAPVRMLSIHPVAHQALKLALNHDQGFYDSLYLALAEAEEGLFATADRRFWTGLKATRHANHIHLVGGE
jgi:predicted nucleic acid-binding protein